MSKPRIVADAADLGASENYCTCCQRLLKGKFAWLELDQLTNTYHDHGGVPAAKSQGWFPFGMTCARNKLRDAANSRSAERVTKPVTPAAD